MDLASLSFSIDSSQANQATGDLDKMQGKADQAGASFNTLEQRTRTHQIALREWRTDAQAFNGVLIQTNNALDDMLVRLDRTRAALDGSAASFLPFAAATRQVDALASSFNQTSVALEAYSKKAAEIGINTATTVQSLERVTQALTGQGIAAKSTAQVLAAYGVDTTGKGPDQAANVLQSFIDRLRTVSDSTLKQQSAQAVLGPNIDPQTLAAISQPLFLSSTDLFERNRREQITNQVNTTTRNAALTTRQTDQTQGIYDKLSSQYNVSTLPGNIFSGLSDAQRADIAKQLGPQSDYNVYGPRSTAGQTALLQYLDKNPESDAANSARTLSASLSKYLTESDTGKAIQFQLDSNNPDGLFQANRTAIGAQFTDDRQKYGLLSAAGSYLGNNARNAFGYYTPPPAPPTALSNDPDPFFLGQTTTAETTGEFGFTAPRRYLQAQQQFRDVNLPGVQNTFQKAFGAAGGDARFLSAQIAAQRGVNTALNPDQDRIDQLQQESTLQGLPRDQRGQASNLLSFLQSQGYETQRFSSGTGPEQLQGLLAGGSGAGIDDKTLAAFRQTTQLGDDNKIGALNDSLKQQLDLQTQLQAIAGQGSAATADLTAKTDAYNTTLAASKSAAVAAVAAENAVLDVQAKRKTAIEAETASLQLANDRADTNRQNQLGAGFDPVARATQANTDTISAQLDDLKRQGASPGQIETRQAQAQRSLGISAQSTVNGGVAGAEQELKIATQLASVAGARADTQAKIARDIQIEAQFAKQIADARTAADGGDTHALDAVLKQIDALKSLKDTIDQVNRTAVVIKGNTDLSNQSALDNYEAGRTPEQRRLDQQALPNLRSGGFTSSDPVASSINDEASLQGANATYAAATAYRESALGRNPNKGGSYTGVFSMGAPAYADVGAPAPGPNGYSQGQQIQYGVARVKQATDLATRVTGQPASFDDAYLTFQQGPAGGPALLRADQSANAVDTLVAAGVSRERAIASITGNSGSVTDTVGGFRATQSALDSTALSSIGAATDVQLLQLRDVYLQNPNDPRILALPPAQRQRLAATAEAQRSQLGLASTDTLQSGAQTLADQQRLAAASGSGSAAVLSATTANTVGAAVRGGTLRPGDAPQYSAQIIQGQAVEQLKSINDQTTALSLQAKQTEGLAEAYSKGSAAVQAYNDKLKTDAIEKNIADLKAQSNQTDATRAAIDADTVALGKFKDAQLAATKATQDARVGQATQNLTLSNSNTQAGLNVPFYATDQERFAAQQEQAKVINAANNPNADNSKFNSAIDLQTQLHQQTADAGTLQTAYKSATGALVSGFESAIVSGSNLRQTFAGLLQDLEKIAIQAAITKPLEGAISDAFGGLGSILGFGGGAGAVETSTLTKAIAASGKVFMNGNVTPFARGGMLDRPTFFAMASGGTALGGEGGNGEALMPVRRLPNGDLGVQSGGGSGGSVTISAPVTIQGGQSGNSGAPIDKQTQAAYQAQMEMTIRQAVKNTLKNEQRPGGMLFGTGA